MNIQENEQLTPEKVFEAALKSELITDDDMDNIAVDHVHYIDELQVLANSLMCGLTNDEVKNPIPYMNVYNDFLKFVKFKMNLSK